MDFAEQLLASLVFWMLIVVAAIVYVAVALALIALVLG